VQYARQKEVTEQWKGISIHFYNINSIYKVIFAGSIYLHIRPEVIYDHECYLTNPQ